MRGGAQPNVTKSDKKIEIKERKILRILLADDDEDYRRHFKRQFERRGYVVETVENGQQILEKLAAGGHDIVFTDNSMPGVTGVQALRQIRATEKTKSLPVIVFTTDQAQDSVEKAGGVFIDKTTANIDDICTTIEKMTEGIQ